MQTLVRKVKINEKFVPNKLKRMNMVRNFNLKNFKYEEENISISKAFDLYINNILPNLENYVETKILNDIYHKIDNDLLKNELVLSYNKRKMLINKFNENKYKKNYETEEKEDIKELKVNVTYSDITKFDHKLVGYLCNFGLKELKKYYKIFIFGHYFKNMLKFTKSFSIMGTPEALKYINHIKRYENRSKVDWDTINFSNYSNMIDEYTYDENLFMNISFELGESLRECLYKKRFNPFYFDLFINSFLYDDIILKTVNSLYKPNLLKLMKNKDSRLEYFNKYLELLENDEDKKYFNSYNLEFVNKKLKNRIITVNLEGNDLEVDLKYTKANLERYKFIPPVFVKYGFKNFTSYNSGILFHGFKGTGKSGLLAFITLHCYKNNYYVMKLPDIHSITFNEKDVERHEDSRLYLQEEVSLNIIRDFLNSHDKEFLEKFKINKDIYGKYNIAGIHEDEPVAVPNTYDPKRKAYFYDSDNFLTNDDWEKIKLNQRKFNVNLKNMLKEPENLLELAEFGIKNPLFGTNIVAEILEQLYQTKEHKVLISVDEYNYLFRPSNFPSFRYENDKHLKGRIPPYHLALCRLFVKFDGHMINNGFKICASSTKTLYKHEFSPEKINFPEFIGAELQGLDYDDFKKYLLFCYSKGIYENNSPSEEEIRYCYMECQGNWVEAELGFKYPSLRFK